MIDGSEKRNRWLGFELRNSHVCEKRSKKKGRKEERKREKGKKTLFTEGRVH